MHNLIIHYKQNSMNALSHYSKLSHRILTMLPLLCAICISLYLTELSTFSEFTMRVIKGQCAIKIAYVTGEILQESKKNFFFHTLFTTTFKKSRLYFFQSFIVQYEK